MEKTKLKADLVDYIQKWADKNCESNWPDIIVHGEFAERMADAAFAVFQAMYESQKYKDEN